MIRLKYKYFKFIKIFLRTSGSIKNTIYQIL